MKLHMMAMILAASLAACGGKAKGPETTTGGDGGAAGATLYDRLGKRDAIALVVKDFVEQRVAKDTRINAFFANADIPGLEAKLIDQICQASGGPCTYTGKDMKTAHVGMNIKDADFNALVEDLKASLDHFKVPAKEQQELIGALAPMHDAIVTAK
ncbi:MAG TPA: group 1 truncated hemoglobin [Kofleriaceae bacterium]